MFKNIFYKSDLKRWIAGFVLIILIYTLFYIFFADRAYIYSIPRKIRQTIKFATTIMVYIIGTFHLGNLRDKWMSQLWHLIHISFLLIITIVGLYDWIFGMVSIKTKEIVASMQEFLISPVLYFAMGLMKKRLD